MTMSESIRHPIRAISDAVSHYTNGHHDNYMQDMHLVAETHGGLNDASLPFDREYALKRQRELASAMRVGRLQALPGLPADPVQ